MRQPSLTAARRPAAAAAAAPLLPPRPPPRRRAAAVHCSQDARQQEQQQQKQQRQEGGLAQLCARAAVLAAMGTAVSATLPAAARAEGWRPRRHMEGLRERKFVSQETPKQAAARKAAAKKAAAAEAAARAAAAKQAPAANDLQGMLASARQKLQQLWGQQPVYSVGYSNRTAAYSSGGPPAPSAYGWLPLSLAGGVALLLVFARNIRWPWAGGRRDGEEGYWVRDRGLGGKMVWVPKTPLPGAAASKPMRPLYEDPDAGEASAAAAAATASADSPWATALGGSSTAREPQLPDWWAPPSFAGVYTTVTRREELQRQARQVLRELQDAKLQGVDYPVSGLVSLRGLCQEAGGYQVKPATEAGRDSMLRAGVRAAIAAGQQGSYGLLGGDPPAKFVCGLARDLGVPDDKAVRIVHGQVAAVCKAALIDAEAAFRGGNGGDLLQALLRLASALQTFPLPVGSAEAEMVASGVAQQTSLEFRKAVFFEFGSISRDLAAVVAELLGFNPELVMPQLDLAAQAQQAQQQLGGQV